MRLEIRTENKQFTVSRAPEPRTDQSGRQRTEKGTGAPQWRDLVAHACQDTTGSRRIAILLDDEVMASGCRAPRGAPDARV